ncbi:peptidase M24 [Ruegeria sp. ANG-R]|uniref:M23 family metallopeptidase n=1 Tax=Ruegeria sp. ANG-R TaxID=1577903 RepID=UPI00057E4217|nr:M23 family metallopeptidase [Ruegeria sp. ANG-R]KIC41480.1 peptidase M24 [Ruegeria sp. ANG-R]
MRSAFPVVILLAASPVASEIRLEIPVDCQLGKTCHIQNYFDHTPTGKFRDFRCGSLTYDGHTGTDFGLPTLANMKNGVDVLAAAPGKVRAVRDGMLDKKFDPNAANDVENRECGNGVVIEHDDGWETQYCHLLRGSVAVAPDDLVETGSVLGKIGLSGKTQFPHLHLSVRKNGLPVDPFVPNGGNGCEDSDASLWATPLEYVSSGLLSVGFSQGIPSYEAVLAGTAAETKLPTSAGAIVLYGHAFGGRAGDVIRLEIFGPDGEFLSEDMVLDKTQAQLYRATGRRLSDTRWEAGEYRGVVTLIREGTAISKKATSVTVR